MEKSNLLKKMNSTVFVSLKSSQLNNLESVIGGSPGVLYTFQTWHTGNVPNEKGGPDIWVKVMDRQDWLLLDGGWEKSGEEYYPVQPLPKEGLLNSKINWEQPSTNAS